MILEPRELDQLAEIIAGKLAAPQKWLNRKEAAEYLRMSESQLDHLTRLGELVAYRPTSKPLYAAADLDDWVRRHREA